MTTTMDSLTLFNRQVLLCQDEAYTLAWYLTGGDDTLAETVTQAAVIAAYRCYAAQGGSGRRLILKQILRRCHLTIPVTGIAPGSADLEEIAALDTTRLFRLPEPERQALVLVTILGLSHLEAAAVMGIPVERLHRFLAQALRKVAAREMVDFQSSADHVFD